METSKALTKDQLEKLKATVRQRFDDLYHRIGTNRQKLATTVLLVDQAINKELTKEKIDTTHEKQILGKLREIEREANNQLPHVHKVSTPAPVVVKTPSSKTPSPKTPATKAKTPVKTKAKKK
jgi:hypothetical protein